MSSMPGPFLNNVLWKSLGISPSTTHAFGIHLAPLGPAVLARVSINRSPSNGLIRRVPRHVLRPPGPSPIGSRDSVHGIDTRARSEDVSDSVDETDDFLDDDVTGVFSDDVSHKDRRTRRFQARDREAASRRRIPRRILCARRKRVQKMTA